MGAVSRSRAGESRSPRRGEMRARGEGSGSVRELRVCRAIRLLAEGRDREEVARAVGALPRTLAAWERDDEFRALLGCLREHGRARDALAALDDLTPVAIAALRRALDGDDDALALRAAREVLERVGPLAERSAVQTIRVEYGSRDGHPVSAAPWADRNPAPSGALQGGGLRETLRQDGDGADSDG